MQCGSWKPREKNAERVELAIVESPSNLAPETDSTVDPFV